MGRFSALELDDEVVSSPASALGESVGIPRGEPADDVDSANRAADREYRLYNFEKALRAYAKALEFSPMNTVAWGGQVRCLLRMGEYREALMWCDKAMETAGESPELLSLKATIMCRMGDFDRAYGLCDAALAMPGTSAWPWLCRGELLLNGKIHNAEFCFEKALAAENRVEVMLEICRRMIFAGYYSKALKLLKDTQEKVPHEAGLWYEQGCCYRYMGMRTAALAAFARTVELEPEFSSAMSAFNAVGKDSLFKRFIRKLMFWR